jgi:hypothetical protein
MATPGYGWAEGTKWAYIDADGVKRTQEGTLTGLTGKLPGQISVNTKSPMLGTHFCYIDSSGNERCIEGTSLGLTEKSLPLVDPRGYWSSGWNLSYTIIHDLSPATWYTDSQTVYAAQSHDPDTDRFLIYRAMFNVDLTGQSSPIGITQAKFVCPFGWVRSTTRDIYIVLVNATDVTADNDGYGIMLNKTTNLGSLLVSAGYSFGYGLVEIPLNSAGIDFLEAHAGGTAQIGIRIDQDISATSPDDVNWEAQDFFTPVKPGDHPEAYMRITYYAPPGHIWVEGTNLAYVDSGSLKRTFEGAL